MKSAHLIIISLLFCLLFLALQDFSVYLDMLCIGLIVLAGVPHGAVDNHLLINPLNRLPAVAFHSLYSGLVILYMALWFLFPTVSFVFFLLLTAYHFGEAYVRYSSLTTVFKTLLNFTTGLALLSGMIMFNFKEFNGFLVSQILMELSSGLEFTFVLYLFITANIIALFLISREYFISNKKALNLVQDIASVLVLYLAFYFLDFLKSFTLFFVFWHSFDVLKQIFSFLKNKNKINGISHFIKFMLPNYIVSILIGGVLLFLVHFLGIDLKLTSIIFLFLASLTLPHALVMSLLITEINLLVKVDGYVLLQIVAKG